jgi:hypothetical protein
MHNCNIPGAVAPTHLEFALFSALPPPHSAHRKAPFRRSMLGLMAAVLLSACVSPNVFVPATEAPKPASGYIGGIYEGGGNNYAFSVVEKASGKRHTIAFFKKQGWAASYEPDQLNIVEMQPGTYIVEDWMVFAGTDLIVRKRLYPERGAIEVEVKPGRVTLLGKFRIRETRDGDTRAYMIRPAPIAQGEVAELLAKFYPAFRADLFDTSSLGTGPFP